MVLPVCFRRAMFVRKTGDGMDIEAWCAGEDGMTVECMAETIREGHETGSDNGYTWCLAAEMTDDDAGLAGMISGRLEFSPCPSDDEWWDLLYACLSRPSFRPRER